MNATPIEARIQMYVHRNQPDFEPKLLPGAKLACELELDIVLDDLFWTVLFQRREGCDELWAGETGDPPGLVASAPRAGDEARACQRLFRAYVRSLVGFARPKTLILPGLLSQLVFEQTVEQVRAGFAANQAAGRRRGGRSAIVRAARRLKLGPEPDSRSPAVWQARCPGTKHFIFLSPDKGEFTCGYCRKRGGVTELEAFVGQRKEGRS